MKTYPPIIYMVPDQKQKVLQMIFWEGQVYYYGKKVMSLLVIMEIRWKVYGEVSVL